MNETLSEIRNTKSGTFKSAPGSGSEAVHFKYPRERKRTTSDFTGFSIALGRVDWDAQMERIIVPKGKAEIRTLYLNMR